MHAVSRYYQGDYTELMKSLSRICLVRPTLDGLLKSVLARLVSC